MITLPIWVVGAFVCILLAFIIENFRKRSKIKEMCRKVERICAKIDIKVPDGSEEAIRKASWNLAYQVHESTKLHEEVAKIRERGR